MSGGRPRTAIGTYGSIQVRQRGRRSVAMTRFRDVDGQLRRVEATADPPALARSLLKERLLQRSGYGRGGQLTVASPFPDLVAMWLADLDLRDLAEGTKESYRDLVRLQIMPAFELWASDPRSACRGLSPRDTSARTSHRGLPRRR